ncbi:hypothetical protein EYF80_029361 [Liparis tanakae]|uniref:Uncharacterized protein n=1 Tax=Liparis tanakae TaxID=230148 RepID=A0A4Z2H672_9TELE|nr:hypothetical protein EYF80_029361 [Liparis tanakae]
MERCVHGTQCRQTYKNHKLYRQTTQHEELAVAVNQTELHPVGLRGAALGTRSTCVGRHRQLFGVQMAHRTNTRYKCKDVQSCSFEEPWSPDLA